ncbi:LysM peptidoglycan-binding domain-containing protein [Liquorilactobacillus uvarum]|uniref:Peptidoglycan binding protein, lysm domain protein n=1 Tax=Liquorilactobacillus uvarum DSM 19971 TaxID=1423812 RepID=A0A0R1Q2G3_9LACO|nr:LysM peptidoglycan-binding domain-containing protein [Liquorilactobacillus uvarum]KRL36996.1 peptidoglycan binding protein, lysm domain protein [Liquorilactobacillus uvarum DSM 19971]
MDIKKILLSAATVTGILTAGTIAANADTVTVKAGDTVSHIASENNTTVSAIEKANTLSNVDLIFVGQQLEVGGSSNSATQTTSTQTTSNTVTPQAPAANSQQAQSSQTQASSASSQQTQNSQAQASSASSQQTQSSQAQASSASSQQTQSSQAQASSASSQQAQSTQQTSTTTSSSSEEAAKAWIANRESGGSYSATNGQYYGKYQLSKSYLNGDYSAANQEAVADQYVQSRYGSWANAQKHSQETGWY